MMSFTPLPYLSPPPDLGPLMLAVWCGNRQHEPLTRHGCGWHLLGCLIPLGIILVVLAILWFAALHP
jgi:hypothetical protein